MTEPEKSHAAAQDDDWLIQEFGAMVVERGSKKMGPALFNGIYEQVVLATTASLGELESKTANIARSAENFDRNFATVLANSKQLNRELSSGFANQDMALLELRKLLLSLSELGEGVQGHQEIIAQNALIVAALRDQGSKIDACVTMLRSARPALDPDMRRPHPTAGATGPELFEYLDAKFAELGTSGKAGMPETENARHRGPDPAGRIARHLAAAAMAAVLTVLVLAIPFFMGDKDYVLVERGGATPTLSPPDGSPKVPVPDKLASAGAKTVENKPLSDEPDAQRSVVDWFTPTITSEEAMPSAKEQAKAGELSTLMYLLDSQVEIASCGAGGASESLRKCLGLASGMKDEANNIKSFGDLKKMLNKIADSKKHREMAIALIQLSANAVGTQSRVKVDGKKFEAAYASLTKVSSTCPSLPRKSVVTDETSGRRDLDGLVESVLGKCAPSVAEARAKSS